MKFTYYKKNDLRKFESRIKHLALEKDYGFDKREYTLDKDEILRESSSRTPERALLKIFGDKSKIVMYLIKLRKHNYLISIGQPLGKDTMGIYVNFNNKPFKQLGKSLIGLPLIVFGGPVGLMVGVGTSLSAVRRGFTIKGPLSKPLSNIITETLGEPVEQKNN